MARYPAEQIFDSLMVSATLPRPELEAHAEQALAAIVGHARQTVPFYQGRLDSVIGPDGRIDREAWHALPPLSRRDLQENKVALTSTRCPASHGEIQERSTSGTTGKPVTVLITDRTKRVEQAVTARFYSWVGLVPGSPSSSCRALGIRCCPIACRSRTPGFRPGWPGRILRHTTACTIRRTRRSKSRSLRRSGRPISTHSLATSGACFMRYGQG